MIVPLADRLVDRIRREGPLTVAAFMDAALHDPEAGYYATAAQRSGRQGDFFTSVDAGPLYGRVLATLVARVWWVRCRHAPMDGFDLVEAGAGNGRLMRDLLDALSCIAPACYEQVRVTLVERSPTATRAQAAWLEPHAARVTPPLDRLPERVGGLLLANELLDALPVHRVVMTAAGLQELYVAEARGRLHLVPGPLSTAALATYLARVGVTLPPGAVADVGLDAAAWMHRAVSVLEAGALLVVDYGAEASHLFGEHHRDGTLTGYYRHQPDPPGRGPTLRPAWLEAPGTRDLTAHVDFTTLRCTAEAAGGHVAFEGSQGRLLVALGLAEHLATVSDDPHRALRLRLAGKTLLSPLALGGSHRALLVCRGLSPRELRAAVLEPGAPSDPWRPV